MIELVLAAALHLSGNYEPHDNTDHASVRCGAGTTESPASSGGQECVPDLDNAAQAPVSAAPTTVIAPSPVVLTQPLYSVGYGYNRPFFPFHFHR